MTARETARQNIIDSVREAATKSHERNYEKLHVLRDGTVSWFETTSTSSDIIDREASGFQAVPNVGIFGTGSFECNCDYCNDKSYSSRSEAIADAIDEELGEIESQMVYALDKIEVGYFADESIPAEARS